MVESLFRLYFMDGKDVVGKTVLIGVAEEAGMDGAAIAARLSTEEDVERVRRAADEASRMGVSGVPCFIFEGRYAVSGAQDTGCFFRRSTLSARLARAPRRQRPLQSPGRQSPLGAAPPFARPSNDPPAPANRVESPIDGRAAV